MGEHDGGLDSRLRGNDGRRTSENSCLATLQSSCPTDSCLFPVAGYILTMEVVPRRASLVQRPFPSAFRPSLERKIHGTEMAQNDTIMRENDTKCDSRGRITPEFQGVGGANHHSMRVHECSGV